MAILLSAIGPDPIVRLQTGGLRAAEAVFRGGSVSPNGFAQLVDLGTRKIMISDPRDKPLVVLIGFGPTALGRCVRLSHSVASPLWCATPRFEL